MLINELRSELSAFRERGLHRQRRLIASPHGRHVNVDGRSLLNFCGNDYLGLANDPRIRDAFKRGIDHWGAGAGAAHLVCGHTAAHHELEYALADFTQRESALLFVNGYAANVGTIKALLSEGDQVIQDRLNHASLLDGGWLSRAELRWFSHRNYAELDKVLAETDHRNYRRRLVVSDGVFSMDGDCCDVDRLVGVADTHDAIVMIDDAHGIGVLGSDGEGLVDPAVHSAQHVPVLMCTLGKAFGCAGAFVAGDRELIEFLIHKARNYVYSTAMPAALAAASLRSLEIVRSEGWRRELLKQHIAYFRAGAAQLGLPLSPSSTPIQPLLLEDANRALFYAEQLEARGFLIRAIRPPTVPPNTARLRITLTANHQRDDVDLLLNALQSIQAQELDG